MCIYQGLTSLLDKPLGELTSALLSLK